MKTIKTRCVLVFALVGSLAPACASAPPASPSQTPAPVAPPPKAEAAAPAPAPAAPVAVPSSPVADKADVMVLTLTNPLDTRRSAETIELAAVDLIKLVPGLDMKKIQVVDSQGKPVLSQLVDTDGDETPDQIVFQADFGPNESKAFWLRVAERGLAAEADYKVYGRFVRERHDDFAWENDVVAHRMYGPDLEIWKKDPLTSSGVDVWVKRVPKLVVNEWYMTDDYHQDHGEGADFYAVGKSRGCGGLGIWSGGKLHVSKNFIGSRVLANGPIRLMFELSYAAWGPGGTRVTETKRVTLDAGSHFNRFESTFKGGKGGLSFGLGISKHPGGVVEVDGQAGWMRVWEPLNGGASGNLGCAIVLPPGSRSEAQQTDLDYLLIAPAPKNGPLTYYVGTAWDRASPIADAAAWTRAVQLQSNQIAKPVWFSLAPLPGAAALNPALAGTPSQAK
jgi:pectinesterase